MSSPVSRNHRAVWVHGACAAAAAALVAVILTWPLAAEMGRSLPGDYGDPVFVTWVMAWVNGALLEGRLEGFWTANIFYPERQTLAFSEHFIAQSLMVAPLQWLTDNPILSYNAAFLLTFILTALGVFVLTRALTGSDAAAYVAAFIAAFNQYRLVYEVGHLHTLSIHWFPLALYALHRYFVTDSWRLLTAAAAALIALNLSSIYYMAYCAPFVLLFACIEGARWHRLTTARTWLELWATAAVVVVATSPFLLPYIDVQQRLGVERPLDEVVRFSATLDHYRVALPPAAAGVVLAVIGAFGGLLTRGRRGIALMLLAFVLLAFWLSLGPVPHAAGRPLGWPGVYALFHHYVPGFSGLRVPARFAMLFFVFLAMLAGLGVALLEQRWRWVGRAAGAMALSIFLVQTQPGAFPLNQPLTSAGLVSPPPAYLTPAPELPLIYQAVDSLRPGAILAELPFGDAWYDLRYMYFSSMHRRRLMNGYSGLFPPSYLARQRVLAQPLLDPDATAQAVAAATHVIVHRGAWADDTGVRVGLWLEQRGAVMIAEADGALLYELPVVERSARSALTD